VNQSATQRLDRMLWYLISILLVILVVVSAVRISSFDAFVDLESSMLTFEFLNNGPEEKIVEFGPGVTIVDGRNDPSLKDLAGATVESISALSSAAGLRLEALSPKQNRIRACLLQGRYFVGAFTADGRHQELEVKVEPDAEECTEVVMEEDILAYPHRVAVEPRVDSRNVEIHPDMSGKLRVEDTKKELHFVSGMTLHLLLEKEPPMMVAFANGRFGIHGWKKIQVLWSDRGKLTRYYFTPLDRLRKYAEDNGLWYSISLLIGVVFGVRKLLLLR
jgi:hypothetical protein